MQQLLSSLEDERQRQFRRFVVVSAALHVALAVLFWLNPTLHRGTALPAVVQVDLVTMADIAPAPKPAPVPAKPPPPPPPPPEVKKVLPKQPAPLPKPKPVEAKPKPKPKPEAKPKEEPKKPPEPAPEQDYEDVLAQLRKEAGETTPEAGRDRTGAAGRGPDAGSGSWFRRRWRVGSET